MSKDACAKCIRDCVFDCVCSKLAGVTLFLFSLEAVPESLQDTVRNRKIPHSACEFCLAMIIIAEQPCNPLDALSSKLNLMLVTQVKY